MPRSRSFALLAPAASPAAELRDVLDTPAATSAFARMGLLNGLARAGKRVVAVGQRGHVLYSDDAGRTWVQAKVPVSSDLVAVTFPTPSHGWAVGHDGVVLHSADAGATWIRQLDGRSAGQAMVAWYAAEAAKGGSGDAAKLLDEAKRFAEQGAENPFLDVWFENERTGFVVGAFNLILRTADGGKTWEPWLHRTDNPKTLHLYAIRPAGGALYIAGEQGLLLKLDAQSGRFRALELPYQGTLFGITGSAKSAVVFGLRGNAFRSADGGKTGRRSRPASRSGSPAARWMRAAWCSSARRATSSSAPTTARASSRSSSSGRRRRRQSSAPTRTRSSSPARAGSARSR